MGLKNAKIIHGYNCILNFGFNRDMQCCNLGNCDNLHRCIRPNRPLFYVPTIEWRLTWSYTPTSTDGNYCSFVVFIYQYGAPAVMLEDHVYQTGSSVTSGTTYIHEGSQGYCLKIISTDIENYNIRIEYDSSAIPEYSTIALVVVFAFSTLTVIAFRRKLRAKT
jgi:hypothetical protein